jgi:transcriptional regulator with XRE-family HTH domain
LPPLWNTCDLLARTRTTQKFRILTPLEKAVCNRVRESRLQQRFTQGLLGRNIGLSRDQLASIEAGRVALRFATGWKLCQFLNLNPAWLATGSGRQSPFLKFSPEKAGLVSGENKSFIDGYAKIAKALEQAASQIADPALDASIFDSNRKDATPELYAERIAMFMKLWLDALPRKKWGALFFHISQEAAAFIEEVKKSPKR